jgi:hypothetical protein
LTILVYIDGFPALAYVHGHHCELVSRNGHVFMSPKTSTSRNNCCVMAISRVRTDTGRANAQLASLYRRNGQEDKARGIEARLLKLLAHADADHPLAAQLKARR